MVATGDPAADSLMLWAERVASTLGTFGNLGRAEGLSGRHAKKSPALKMPGEEEQVTRAKKDMRMLPPKGVQRRKDEI